MTEKIDGEKKRIAVIDGQISPNTVYRLSGKVITCRHVVNGVCGVGGGDFSGLSHGSVCTALAAEFFPEDDIIGIAVANEQEDLSLDNVCTALSWCGMQSIQMICMSIGTTNWLASLPMKDITKKLADQGIKIFAAVDPAGILTFPACYPWITAVKCEMGNAAITRNLHQLRMYDVSVGYFPSAVLDKLSLEDRFFLSRTSSMAVAFAASQMTRKNERWNTWNENNGVIKDINTDKKRLEEEPIEIPIVRIIDQRGREIQLQHLFWEKGYMACLFSGKKKTNWAELIAQIDNSENFEIAIHAFREASIIFVDKEVDRRIVDSKEDCILDISKETIEEAYEQIRLFFS